MSNVRNLAEAREAKRSQETPKEVGKGFTLLHRKIQETEFYRKDSQAVHLWVHLIMSANHADASVKTEYGVVQLQRGQFITGRNTLANETGIEPNRVQYLLKKFKKMGMIETVSPGKFTVITISKYGEYQGEIVPEDSQKIPRPNAGVTRLAEKVVPEDSQKIPTNNNITNNSISKDIECASPAEKSEIKKPSISCEQVIESYQRILPECQGINIITDKRRNLIRTFWQKAGKVTRKLDGHSFTLADWEDYLNYISSNCRWMLENRPDHRTGKTWRKKGLEYFLNIDVYAKTREGACDDL